MDRTAALATISGLLDAADGATANTSMRLPVALRDAAALAVSELGAAASTTALAASALRSVLEGVVVAAALEEHFGTYPHLRPDLGDLAVAAAEQDGNPLARRPELLRRAAVEVTSVRPRADADDVLLWAAARQIGAA